MPDLGTRRGRLSSSVARMVELEAMVRRPARQRSTGRAGDAALSPAERVARVLDPDGPWVEIGTLRGHHRPDGALSGAGLMTGIGTVAGRPVVIAATVPAVGGGRWGDEVVAKLLRAQEIALRQRVPIAYLLESGAPVADVRDGLFPGGYGPGRALALATALKRAGVGQVVGRIGTLGGAAAILVELTDDVVALEPDGLAAVRAFLAACPAEPRTLPATRPPREPAVPIEALDAILPGDHRRSYDMTSVLGALLDGGGFDEFQPRHGAEMICGHGWIEGIPVAVIANHRGLIPSQGGAPKIGGIIYPASAAKTGYFIETASRQGIPILFVQDVSGFMLGVEAEHAGIIRAGAGMVEAMATARSARIALTVNHASGAGYYAMASQGFEPDFTLAWPTGRIGAMEAEAAINAVHGTALARLGGGAVPTVEMRNSMAAMRETFERDLDATHAAAHGHVDCLITPESTRATLAFLLRVTTRPQPPI